jgi:hypothetical protein
LDDYKELEFYRVNTDIPYYTLTPARESFRTAGLIKRVMAE